MHVPTAKSIGKVCKLSPFLFPIINSSSTKVLLRSSTLSCQGQAFDGSIARKDAMNRRTPVEVMGVAARFRTVRQGSVRIWSNELSVTCIRDSEDEKETQVRRDNVGVDITEAN